MTDSLQDLPRCRSEASQILRTHVPMPTVQSYKDLKVWQQGMDLVEACYRATATFPPAERFGLTSQLMKLDELSRSVGRLLHGLYRSLDAKPQ